MLWALDILVVLDLFLVLSLSSASSPSSSSSWKYKQEIECDVRFTTLEVSFQKEVVQPPLYLNVLNCHCPWYRCWGMSGLTNRIENRETGMKVGVIILVSVI